MGKEESTESKQLRLVKTFPGASHIRSGITIPKGHIVTADVTKDQLEALNDDATIEVSEGATFEDSSGYVDSSNPTPEGTADPSNPPDEDTDEDDEEEDNGTGASDDPTAGAKLSGAAAGENPSAPVDDDNPGQEPASAPDADTAAGGDPNGPTPTLGQAAGENTTGPVLTQEQLEELPKSELVVQAQDAGVESSKPLDKLTKPELAQAIVDKRDSEE